MEVSNVLANVYRENKLILSKTNIDISVEKAPRSGLKSWHGSFTTNNSEFREHGKAFKVVLHDDREGEFITNNVNTSNGSNFLVHFTGLGPLE
jgi:hypothetical protein